MFLSSLSALAEPAASTPAAAPAGGGLMGTLIYFAFIIFIFYFLMIRPQKKKDKQLRAMIDQLIVGDEIVTIGGIHGKIVAIKDDTVTIESAPGVEKSNIRIARWAIKECITIKE